MMHFIKTMAPGWFAMVMGTAVTSLAFTLLEGLYPDALLPSALALLFHVLAVIMLIALGIPAVLRIVFFPAEVKKTIFHPGEGSFYATFPVAMLIMAAQWTARGIAPEVVALLWWAGTILICIISYMVLFGFFSSAKLKLEMVTPAQFIPAVGLAMVPVAGAALASAAQGIWSEIFFGINVMCFGAGVFMYMGLLALTMARHFIAAPIEGALTPTLLVHLAPLGVIPLSLLALLTSLGDASALRYGTLAAAAFFGAAMWWLLIAGGLTLKNILARKLPFALSWWAFLFPVGAVTVLALRLSALLKLQLLPVVCMLLCVLLCLIWLADAAGTFRAFKSGKLLPKAAPVTPRENPSSDK